MVSSWLNEGTALPKLSVGPDEGELVLGPVLRDSSVLFHGLAPGVLRGRHSDHHHVPKEDTEASEVRNNFFRGRDLFLNMHSSLLQ